MNLQESFKSRIIRISIPFFVAVIGGIYYLSEIKPFPYEGNEKQINHLQRFDAELNEAVVLIRFGILKQYGTIVESVNATDERLAVLQELLNKNPNAALENKFNIVLQTIKTKREITSKFERINPILINAILNFSTILGQTLESESNNQLIEDQLEKASKTDQIENANILLRGILIYVYQRNESKNAELKEVVKYLRAVPENEKLPKLDLALNYADKILELQPQMSQIDATLFQVPTIQTLNELQEAFNDEFKNFDSLADKLRVILYILVFMLLLTLRWLFSRLQNTVDTLHIEVQRKIKAEKELAKINRQLEQRVADRTHELTVKNKDLNVALGDLKEAQEQLIMQEKMASVGMLTTGIAHEIKNPLNFVNNFSDISVDLVDELHQEMEAHKEKLPPEELKYIQEILDDLKTNCSKIKEHGVRADNIVKNMLMHSQESGVQKEMIDLKVLMDENIQIALESFRGTSGKFDVNIEKSYGENVEKVLGVPQAIGRLFIYLVDNALYAMKEKQTTAGPSYNPVLSVAMQQKDDMVTIKIRDNGTGIPKKSIDKVFEPFFTTKPTGKGNTGLGLSICYDTVVKQHKGELRVTSEEGAYTEFTVVLPVNPRKSS